VNYPICHFLTPLAILAALLVLELCCLTFAPVIDAHPAWKSVWDVTHKTSTEHNLREIIMGTAMLMTIAAVLITIRLQMQTLDSEIRLFSFYALLLIFHLGWQVIPYYANGLHNAAIPIEGGYYDPKALPPMNGMIGYIWGMGLFGGVILLKLIFPLLWIYRIMKHPRSVFVWALMPLFIADALLETLTPDFWVWFMD